MSAVDSRSRTDVHDVVRRKHGVLVMLHHHQGISDIRKVPQCFEELLVVLLMEADGWLVQNVEHAHQAGTDLGGQPDPLRLAAGKGGCASGKSQVVQAYVFHEVEPGLDLLYDLLCDVAILLA